jgi:hypothetical protein
LEEVLMSNGYPADAGANSFLLTVRGKFAAKSVDEARQIHNSTAGAPQSIEGARSLGDLSHNVFTGVSDALNGELLFIDIWNSGSGLGQFFGNHDVQKAAAMLFSSRDGIVWSSLAGAPAFNLLMPAGKEVKGIGLLKTKVTSLGAAADAFTKYAGAIINRARRSGMVSHSTWTRVPNPGEQPGNEIISVDRWMDPEEMGKYYEARLGFEHLGPVFAGEPDTSTWQAAPGHWNEW